MPTAWPSTPSDRADRSGRDGKVRATPWVYTRDATRVCGEISAPRTTTPCRATRLSAPSNIGAPLQGRTPNPMLRIQQALPDGYLTASPDELADRIAAAKATLGDRLFVLGHHYQRDEVMRWADARGDSYRLSVLAKERPQADYIVFCGVHFMAESADVLTGGHQQVILPDLNAGCSMADLADIDSVEEAWEVLEETVDISTVVPIKY